MPWTDENGVTWPDEDGRAWLDENDSAPAPVIPRAEPKNSAFVPYRKNSRRV